jgi:hypothetical protein
MLVNTKSLSMEGSSMATQSDEEFINEICQTTAASPKQVLDLLKKHHGDHKAVRKEARKTRAEA